MPAFDRLSINQVTLREQWSLAQAIEGFSRHGIHAIAVWRDKLAELGVDEGARMLRDHAMEVTGFCIAGLQTTRDKTAFQERLDDNRRVIEEAATIGAKAIIFVAGGLEDGEKDLVGAKTRCKEALVALLPEAKAAGMTLAVEPLHPMLCASRSVLASLAEANDWCDEIGAGPELGLAIDVYHLWWDPNLAREIQRAGPRIAAYHINDWLHDTRDLRLDRGMMGDGAIDLPGFRALMEAAGYTGHHEVEIFSQRNWWRRDADEVVEVIKDRFATVC